MAAFHVEPEEAVSTTFHGYTVYKPGFWSQGPAMIEALNILEGFPIGQMRAEFGRNTSTPWRRRMKLAYADRDTYYGDPEFQPDSRRDAALQGLRRGAAQADRR